MLFFKNNLDSSFDFLHHSGDEAKKKVTYNNSQQPFMTNTLELNNLLSRLLSFFKGRPE